MPQVGDIIQVTMCSEIFDQDVCNVFYYAVGVWTGNVSITDFLADWLATGHASWKAVQSDELRYTGAIWNNLTDPLEQASYVEAASLVGDRTAEALPPYTAFSVVLNRTDQSTRQGYKRIGGATEDLQADGVNIVAGATKTAVQNFAAGSYTDASDIDLDPVIVGRLPNGSLDLSRINPVTGAVFQDNLTTQSSRKFGRGS